MLAETERFIQRLYSRCLQMQIHLRCHCPHTRCVSCVHMNATHLPALASEEALSVFVSLADRRTMQFISALYP